MNYYIECTNFKRFFSVPCSVAEKYLKLASSDAIKVLLYILSTDTSNFTSEDIMKATGLDSIYKVDDSIIFWKNANVLIENNNSMSGVETNKNTTTDIAEKKDEKVKQLSPQKALAVKYSPKDIALIVDKSDDLKFLMDSVQSVLKRPINYTEQGGLINLHQYYGLPSTVILMLVDYCNQIGKSNIHYVETIAKSWCEEGITTHEAAEAELIRMIERNTFENKIKNAFGITNSLTPTQKEYISKWKSLDMSLDMITYAYEKCLDNINKLSFPYINRIIEGWESNGYKAREDVIETQKKSKSDNKDSDVHSYDLDEFYRMAINNTPDFKGE